MSLFVVPATAIAIAHMHVSLELRANIRLAAQHRAERDIDGQAHSASLVLT